jgi:hypothetical protein
MQQPVLQQPLPQPGQVKKRRKKKPAVAQGQPAPPAGQQPPPLMQSVPPLGQLVSAPMVISDTPQVPVQPLVTVPEVAAPVAKQKKAGKCWKCDVNTHTTKACKAIH